MAGNGQKSRTSIQKSFNLQNANVVVGLGGVGFFAAEFF
jgi:hypothetical protein